MDVKIATLVLFSCAAVTAGAQSNVVSMAESGIRRVATKKPMPVYPAGSVSSKSSGVAVASITSGADGRVAAVTILEAPDDAIAEAVRKALLAWEIPPTTVVGRAEKYGAHGKVTFYFQIVNGKGRVSNAEDLPGGPKPEPKEGPPSTPPGTRSAGPPTVSTHSVSRPEIEIGESELAKLLAATPRPTILDIRERTDFKGGHREGAINIPRDELAIRAWIELDRSRPVVIDCSQAETARCHMAARLLLNGPKLTRVFVFLP